MARRKASRRDEVWSRHFEINRVEVSVSSMIERLRGAPASLECRSWLTLQGTLSEPVRETDLKIEVNVSPDDGAPAAARPSVGAVIQTTPHVQFVVSLPHREFDRAWTLAASGQLKHGYLAFTRPLRGKASVRSFDLSNVGEE